MPRKSSASGARRPLQQEADQRERGEDGERGMDLADALEPAQELRRVGVDPDHFGGLVGDADLDQLVQLLVDAAFEQIDQPLPGDVGTAATAQLLDLVELVQRVLEFAAGSASRRVKLGGFRLFAPRARRWRAPCCSGLAASARSDSITLCR